MPIVAILNQEELQKCLVKAKKKQDTLSNINFKHLTWMLWSSVVFLFKILNDYF